MSILDPIYHVWKVENVGECSMLLSCVDQELKRDKLLLPNATEDFIEKYGRSDCGFFMNKYGVYAKEHLVTPMTLVLYFEDKVPDWAEVGMEVLY